MGVPTGYFLLDNQNRHAPVRDDGRRFMGHASRRQQVRCIGVHTAENFMDDNGVDTGAEAVARYLSTTDRQASYHELYDSDSHVACLPPGYTAFGIRGFNSATIHVSFACRAAQWGQSPQWSEKALRIGAARVDALRRRYGIPLRWLTREQALQGASGFVRHSTMDPARRSDPGARFPAERWFALSVTKEEEEVMGTLFFGPSKAHIYAREAGRAWYLGPTEYFALAKIWRQDTPDLPVLNKAELAAVVPASQVRKEDR